MTSDRSYLTQAKSRPLGDMEKLFWATSLESNVNWVQPIRVSGLVAPRDLERALKNILQRHPLLPVCVELGKDEVARFFHFADCPIPLRVAERQNPHSWITEAEKEINDPIDPARPPLLRAVLVQGERISEILLCGTHCNIDGQSILVIIQDLMHALGRLDPLPSLPMPLPFEELYPPLRERTKSPDLADVSNDEPTRVDEGKAVCHARSSSSFRVAYGQLEQGETSRLVESCRNQQVTVHAAICAAFLSAFESLFQNRPSPIVRCASPINLRSACPPIKDDVGVYISMMVLVHQLDQAKDFWALARTVKEQLVQGNHPEYIAAVHSALREKIRTAKVAELVAWSRQAISYEFGVSNLGKLNLPVTYGALQIERLWPPIAVSNPAADTVTVFTFNGQLTVMITSIADRSEFASLALEYLRKC